MRQILTTMAELPLRYPGPLMALLVFGAAALMSFGLMATVRTRNDVKRRAAGVRLVSTDVSARSLRFASAQAAQRLIDYANRHFSLAAGEGASALRRRLVQAGFLDARAVAGFVCARLVAAAAFAGAAAVFVPSLVPQQPRAFWPLVWLAACVGYMAPKFYLDRRIKSRTVEHRCGFPDFMDLLVVCANSGLSMEAALDRVGRELADTYPSLSANIYMTTLELRAGRRLGEALEHFAERINLEEAKAFATLLQQSEELGSSLSDTLRVYSEEMRNKRMSFTEEKAYSLPAKLSVPLILCIFPVIIIVIMLPVYVRIRYGVY